MRSFVRTLPCERPQVAENGDQAGLCLSSPVFAQPPEQKEDWSASAAATTHTLVLSRTSRASHRLLERDHCIHHTMQSVRNTASCMFQAVEASDKCNSSFCTEASALRGKCRNQKYTMASFRFLMFAGRDNVMALIMFLAYFIVIRELRSRSVML